MNNKRRDVFKNILVILTAIGGAATILRLKSGLGSTTALSVSTPWGLWIGFDVMAGVALAAGGFVTAGAVYILHLENYKKFVRSAILTAFLGYAAVAIAITLDIGQPWRIWHPIIFWNHHSVMFEVAWCVMLYLTVLTLEFTPTILEHPILKHKFFQFFYKLLKKSTLPLVIIGIILSTLHQSSLGSLFLIVPFRLYPLAYSPLLPVLFFVSAVGLGLMMVTFESLASAYFYNHKPDIEKLSRLATAGSIILLFYFILRVSDLAIRGILPMVFNGSWQSYLFIFEMFISSIVPATLLFFRSIRNNAKALAWLSLSAITGIVLYRLDVGVIMIKKTSPYFPTLLEFAVTLGIVSASVLAFFFFVEHFNVYGEEEKPIKPSPYEKPAFDPASLTWRDNSFTGSFIKRSMFFVVVFALSMLFMPSDALYGYKTPPHPVKKALGGEILKIDWDRGEKFVMFPHQLIQKKLGGKDSCIKCHHTSIPGDYATPCYECHKDLYSSESIFNHQFHQKKLGENLSCMKCHTGNLQTSANAKPCYECHKRMFPMKSVNEKLNYLAPGYKDAMHGLCINCHKEMVAEKLAGANFSRCTTCHRNGSW